MATTPDWGTPAWRVDVDIAPSAPPARCDVAVVGGGFTGLSAAYHLAQRALHQPRIADIFKKNGWNHRSFDLADNPGDVARAGFGFGGNALWRYEFDAIGGGEIAEGGVG